MQARFYLKKNKLFIKNLTEITLPNFARPSNARS